MERNYSYPIDYDWTKEQMEDVVNIWRMVELAYEKEIDREEFLISMKNSRELFQLLEKKKGGAKNLKLFQITPFIV